MEPLAASIGEGACPNCGEVVTQAAEAPIGPDFSARPLRLPPGLRVEQDGDTFTIIRKWPVLQGLLFVAGSLIVLAAGILSLAGGRGDEVQRILPLVPLALAGPMLYWGMANLCNSTRLRVGGGTLCVTNGPIAWSRGGRFAAAEISWFYHRTHVHRSSKTLQERCTYGAWLVFRDGPHYRLVSGLDHPQQAEYICRRLENALGRPGPYGTG